MIVGSRRFHSSYERGCQEKHFSAALRETSIVACIKALLLRGEDFGFNARSATQHDRSGLRLLVFLEWFHVVVPTAFGAKLHKPAVGISANHHPMRGSRPMAFLGYPRGHRINPETGC